MHTFFNVVIAVVGAAVIITVLDSALRTFVLPRAVTTTLTRLVFISVRLGFDMLARSSKTYEARDRIMAVYAPIALFATVAVWMCLVISGFALLFHGAIGVTSWRHDLELSGSSFFTLGFASFPHGTPSNLLVFVEAAVGLGVLSLLIAFLPTIYAAFSRRELAVAQLSTRAGTPPSGVELLERYHAINWLDQLPELWGTWEEWFAGIDETHTSLAVLVFFRSPKPERSWITAAGALLDAASLAQSTLAIPWSPQAGLCIRSGALALRNIGGLLDVPFDPDPSPDDPISIARSEFDEAYERLGAAGVPIRPDRERCWKAFAGWRVNYDAPLLGIAGLTMAPYAPWSSDRSLRFRRRVLRRRPRTGRQLTPR
jgi:hypothetical protein